MPRIRAALVLLQLFKLPDGDDRCHGPAGALDDKLRILIKRLFQELTQMLSGFQGIDCFDRGTRLCHRIARVDITNITISIIASTPSTSSRGVYTLNDVPHLHPL